LQLISVLDFPMIQRKVHEVASGWIVGYLKATSSEGRHIAPSEVTRLDCCMDADFAGLWDRAT